MYFSKILIKNIISLLAHNYLTNDGVVEIIKLLRGISLDHNNCLNQLPNIAPKQNLLSLALNNITDKKLLPIKISIQNALPELKWSIDNGSFYPIDSGISENYLNGNMNCELIGPENGIFHSTDFRLGLFLLSPNIFYQDHNHKAPELYLNLSNKTKWRFNCKKWQNFEEGSLIYNKPWKIHAMRVFDLPFLSIWCWPKNSSEKCRLIPQRD